jgi:diguanylate cyclase (GGDEF)-like protein/PAS domain S-box-containing protein
MSLGDGGDPITTGLILGYPVGDMVLLFGVAAVAVRRAAGVDPKALASLIIGLFLVLAADVGYGQLSLADSLGSQHWTDVLYMASTVAIGFAGFLQARARPSPAGELAITEIPRPLLYLPYVALVAGYGTLLITARGSMSGTLSEMITGGTMLTILILVRQELVLRQNSRLLADRARRESESRFRSLGVNSSDAIALVTPAGVVVDATDSVKRVFGLETSSLIGRRIAGLAHTDDAPRLAKLIADSADRRPGIPTVEWRIWDGNGIWRQVETIAANLIDDPAIGHIVLTTRDVRERKALEQRLQQVALHDVLTGLPNRALFLDRVDHALLASGPHGGGTIVLILNIDGFKRYNDNLGPPAGDGLLREVARRLEGTLGPADTCARLGGDEFGVLLNGIWTEAEGRAAAERIVASFGEPFELDRGSVQITARLGIVVSEATSDSPTALLRDAGVAMSNVVEAAAPGRTIVFEPRMRHLLEGRFELEADLRRALERDELVLQYQPIVDLATGEIVAAEALVRWDHPTRGRLAPNVFIPLAEETDLIDDIGSWVLKTACSEVAQWARAARTHVPRVSVNLSPHQVADPQLPWKIQAILAQAGAVPAWLALEVTEGVLMENTAAVLERLHAIRSLGISIAIDDFGTGYSSLAYLQQFPMSQIKIDRSFVTPLEDPDREPGIVRAIVEIGNSLGMATVAEGIETDVQLQRLRALGCTYGQGFLLGRPLDRSVFAMLVANPVRPDWVRGSAAVVAAAVGAAPGTRGRRKS